MSSPEVTLTWIFNLSREVITEILDEHKLSHLNEKDNLNKTLAFVAILYYNDGLITSVEEQAIVADPDFHRSMSVTSSLTEGLILLKRFQEERKLTVVLDKEVKVKDVGNVIMEYLTPEEAYVHNMVSPNPTLAKISAGITAQQALNAAAQSGWIEGMKQFLDSKEITEEGWEKALHSAAQAGNLESVLWLSEHNFYDATAWNRTYYYAALSGSIPVMELVHNKVGGVHSPGWETETNAAVQGGHIPALEWLLEKGARRYLEADTGRLNELLGTAAEYGHMHMIEYLLPRSANLARSYNAILSGAAFGGRISLMQWAVERGANDFDGALLAAARGGRVEILPWLEARGADDWERAFLGAAEHGGSIPVLEWLSTPPRLGVIPQAVLNEALGNAVMMEARIPTMEWLIARGANNLEDLFVNPQVPGAAEWLRAKIAERRH